MRNILAAKCPKCKSGQMFKQPFSFSKPLAMDRFCSNCSFDFEPETGYYWGAMYVSYALASILFLLISGVSIGYFGLGFGQTIAIVIGVAILAYFPLMRFSRALWLHLDYWVKS